MWHYLMHLFFKQITLSNLSGLYTIANNESSIQQQTLCLPSRLYWNLLLHVLQKHRKYNLQYLPANPSENSSVATAYKGLAIS